MAEYIKLGFSILLLVFIFFGFIWGLIRGLRKTLSRGLFLLITTIILLFVTIPITGLLLNIPVTATISNNTEIIRSGSMPISEVISEYVKLFIGESFVTKNPEILNIITAIPIILINSIVYLILFWVLKYLLYPLNYLFYRLLFAPKKKKEILGFSEFNSDNDDNLKPIDNDDKDYLHSLFDTSNSSQNQSNNTQPETNSNENTNTDTNKVVLGSIFDNLKTEELNQSNNQFEQITPLMDSSNTSIETPDSTSDYNTNKIDNSKFNPDITNNQILDENKTGLFIKEDPKAEENKTLEFDVHITNNNQNQDNINISDTKTKRQKKIKPKKYRFWGGLVGIAVGLLVSFNTMIPIYGIFNIIENANNIKLDNLSENTITLDNVTNGFTTELLNGYESSAMNIVSTYTGLNALGVASFDVITSKTIDGTKITLREDINNILKTVNSIDEMLALFKQYSTEGNLTGITQEQLTQLLAALRDVVDKTKEVKIINVLTDYLIPLSCNIIIENEIKLTDNDNVNNMITDLLTALSGVDGIKVFDEIYAILDVAEYINNQRLLVKIINNDLSKPVEILNSLDSDFGRQLTTKLFNSKLVYITAPHLINIGLQVLDEQVKFGFKENNATSEEIKSSIIDLIDQLILTGKTFDDNSSIYITPESLIPLGNALNTIKNGNLLTEDTYLNLVDYAISLLQDIIRDAIPEELVDTINNKLLANTTRVNDWSIEFTKINNAFTTLRNKENGILGDIQEGKNLRQGFTIHFDIKEKENVINNLGKALDQLESTTLFGTPYATKLEGDSNDYNVTTTSHAINALFDYINNNIIGEFDDNDQMKKLGEIITDIQTNLVKSNHTYLSTNPFWENEFKAISPLITNLYTTIETGEFEMSQELGTQLDRAKTGVLLGNDTTLKLMSKAIDIVKDQMLGEEFVYNDGTSSEQSTDDLIYELFEAIKTKLNSNETYDILKTDNTFWQKEINAFISLKNIADKSDTITDIDKAILLAEDLDTVYSSVIIPKAELSKTIASVIKQIKSDVTTGTEGEINNIIDSIANDLENDTFFEDKELKYFWAIELNYIKELYNIKFEDDGEYKVLDNLTIIGKTLDQVTLGYTKTTADDPTTPDVDESNTESIRKSYFISHNMLRNVLKCSINEIKTSVLSGFEDATIKTSVSTALTSIQTNLGDTTNIPIISFERELYNLQKLAKLEISTDLFESNAEISKLTYLGYTLDNIAFNTQSVGGNEFYDELVNSKIITRSIINTMLKDIVAVAKTTNSTDAINTTIDNIAIEIQNVIDNNSIISWTNELGFINDLMKLKEHTDISSATTNTYNEIGEILDKIAFNRLSDNTFDSKQNSVIITRSNLNTTIANLILTVKTTDNQKLHATIDNLSTSITTNSEKIFSWIRELSFVDKLIKLNENNISAIDTTQDKEKLLILGENLDALAFNILYTPTATYDDCKYTNGILTYKGNNSVIITRPLLKITVADFLETAKDTEATTGSKEEIINELIENTTNTVNITNEISNNYYTNFNLVFEDLISVKDTVDESVNNNNNKNLNTLNGQSIDIMLDSLQDKLVCHNITTRKVAILLLSEINKTMINLDHNYITTEAYIYTISLIDFYNSRIALNVNEAYNTNADLKLHPRPFTSLQKAPRSI